MPAAPAYLVWSIMATLLGIFLVFHLWQFDRFKCLKWNSGPHSGAFKRIMTYSYFITLPLILAYAYGFTYIKYSEGYTVIPGHGIIPTPYKLWSKSFQSAVLPLQLAFSLGWSLEMVTHLEELCFWLFLVNAGHAQQDWFHSAYFKTWTVGSVLALIYMPLVVIFTRSDPVKMEAYTFLAGSIGSLSLTLWFTPILWTFPSFLKNLKSEGVDVQTLVRLTKFHELNTIRVMFRFMFTVPFVILGVDGIQARPVVNTYPFFTDLCTMIAAVGCIVSSGITLVIFFPRNIETELSAREQAKLTRSGRRLSHIQTFQSGVGGGSQIPMPSAPRALAHGHSPSQRVLLHQQGSSYDEDMKTNLGSGYEVPYVSQNLGLRYGSPEPSEYAASPMHLNPGRPLPTPMMSPRTAEGGLPMPVTYQPNRRLTEQEGGGVELGAVRLTQDALELHNKRLSKHHLLHNYTSPLDLAYSSGNRK